MDRTSESKVYYTPDKTSKPDLKNQSYLKTTMPSGIQLTQQKSPSQFGAHYNKKQTYEFGANNQAYTQKRTSKNQWQQQLKVQQYEAQISRLRQYLKGCQCDCCQKNEISRIFGFNWSQEYQRMQNQQKRVIKALGSKVKSLIQQNNSLKYQNVHHSQLNIEEIIQQNRKLQMLLEDHKYNDSLNNQKLFHQNEMLKDELYKLKLQYQQQVKLIEIQNDSKLAHLKTREHQLLRKIELLELQNQKSLRNSQLSNQKISIAKLNQIQQINAKLLRQTQNVWKKKLEDQQNYYSRIRDQWESSNKEYGLRIQSEQLRKLKQHYIDIIQAIQVEQKVKFQRLANQVKAMDRKIDHTNDSISHLKFERANRIQSTIRKSRNIAQVPSRHQGQPVDQQPRPQKKVQLYESGYVQKRPQPQLVPYQINSPSIQISNQKIYYLEKQITELKAKLTINQKIISQKTQTIIRLQNQILGHHQTIHNLNNNLIQARQTVVIQEVVKQVPIGVIPKDYSDEVKNIKEAIKSCNLSNFDIFQTEFNQILEQRNQMNEKLLSLKKEAKQSTKVLALEKHLKLQRDTNKQLEQFIKNYEKEIQSLKNKVIDLQSQLQKIQTQAIVHDVDQMENHEPGNLSDGKAGLEWQKVVKHCLEQSINRLQNLENKMKDDLKVSRQIQK